MSLVSRWRIQLCLIIVTVLGLGPAYGQSVGYPPAGGAGRFHDATAISPFYSGPVGRTALLQQSPLELGYVDLDGYASVVNPAMGFDPSAWHWQLLPDGIIYPSYLAGVKEPRFAARIVNVKNDGWLMDGTLGTRVGLFRFGNSDPNFPEGWQLDAEGAAQVRLDIPNDVNVRSVDFRAGAPLTYGYGPHRVKFGYYHLSSHLGDEFMLQNPGFTRLNYSRDVLLLGYLRYVTPELRIYAETGWAFQSDVGEPWEFQFGFDYLPVGPTGIYGAPFMAVNGHLRQEVDFGGAVTAQAGLAWRGVAGTNLLRAGLHVYNGKSSQFSFFNDHEQQIGFGLWYDF